MSDTTRRLLDILDGGLPGILLFLGVLAYLGAVTTVRVSEALACPCAVEEGE